MSHREPGPGDPVWDIDLLATARARPRQPFDGATPEQVGLAGELASLAHVLIGFAQRVLTGDAERADWEVIATVLHTQHTRCREVVPQ